MTKLIDIIGKKFGKWIVTIRVANKYGTRTRYLCECECGTKREVEGSSLRTGSSKSCGCVSTERISKLRLTHGKTKTDIFVIWQGIKDRCYNEKGNHWNSHGKRGIKVYEEWIHSFEKFELYIKTLGIRPEGYTLDRINNDGDYEPHNLRWASPRTQANNTRSNRIIEFKSKRMTMAEWAREINISYKTLATRLYDGWSIEKALSTPTLNKTTKPHTFSSTEHTK
jgi:hypothetical protein